jgi:hypothetical protein
MKYHVKDYIKVFDNSYFTKQQCKLIINSFDKSLTQKHTFYNVYENKKKFVGNDPNQCFLKQDKFIPTGDLIKDQWFKLIGEYISKFLQKEKMTWYKGWNGYSFPKFIEYKKGTSMKKHCDHIHGLFEIGGKPRGVPTLTLITALNDDYSGGDLVVCEKYKYKLKQGETIIHPSNFLYPHEVTKITKGKRYTAISWVY